jgi:hypothetical protein
MSGRLALSHHSIVAAGTWRCDTGVIEPSARKGQGAPVTSLAGRGGNDMVLRLAERSDAVMAGRAAIGDIGMAELRTGCR